METWVVVGIFVIVLLVAGVVYWYAANRQTPTPPEPALPPFRPQYVSGGASYMITMGIGTPSEIPAFLLCGLSTGGTTSPAATTTFSHVYMYRRRRR